MKPRKPLSSPRLLHAPRLLALAAASVTLPLPAAITLDGTMGTSGPITPTGTPANTFTIPDTVGKTVGKNLFHSFHEFNLGRNQTATFTNTSPTDFHNVIARVTGPGASTIQGSILSTIANADVYLINPSGVIFGQGASINVPGAFTATTADYLSFRDKDTGAELGRFWASRDRTTTLTSAAPSHFGFLPSNASTGTGAIAGTIDFRLANTNSNRFSRNDFAAVGRTITATGSRFRNGTSYTFQALQAGEAPIDPHSTTPHPGGPYPLAGDITFSNVMISSASGGTITVHAAGNLKIDTESVLNGGSDAGTLPGGISLRTGGDLTITGSEILFEHSGGGQAGNIDIHTGGHLTLDDQPRLANGTLKASNISTSITTPGTGPGIHLTTGGDLILRDSSRIYTEAFTGGTGGDLAITTTGHLQLLNSAALQTTADQATGGHLTLTAGKDIRLTNGGTIQTTATGPLTLPPAGTPTYPATGGHLTLTAGGDLLLSSSGIILSSAHGLATGGHLHLQAAGTTRIDHLSLIQSFATPFAHGGDIALKTRHLTIDGPQLAIPGLNRSIGIESVIDSQAPGTPPAPGGTPAGTGGDIRVHATGDVTISNTGGIFSSTNGPGTSGDITLAATSLKITGTRNYLPGEETLRPRNFFITGISNKSAPGSTGAVGSIQVDVAKDIRLLRGGFIDATTFSDSDSGDVTVIAGTIDARRARSDYFTGIGAGTVADDDPTTSGGGRGANVNVTAGNIRLLDGAQITASSRGSGDAGSVLVHVGHLYASGVGRETPFLFTGESGIAAATLGAGSGTGGDVHVIGRSIHLTNGASISSTNRSPAPNGGFAGSVILEPVHLTVDGGRIEVSSAAGNAGQLRIEGGALLDFRHADIVAQADNEGGDIVIRNAWNVILDHTTVSANAIRGDGGNIDINSASFLSNQSTVTASSQFAADGQVLIDSQAVLSGAEGELDIAPLDITDSLQPECTDWIDDKDGRAPGSFIRTGRGGAARLPGGYLPSLRLQRTE